MTHDTHDATTARLLVIPDEVERLRGALAEAEARVHELDVQLAGERQTADVQRGNVLRLEARATRLQDAARSAALILATPGGDPAAARAILRDALGDGPDA